jgi:hypothetical protein
LLPAGGPRVVLGSGAPGIRVCAGAEGLAVGGDGRQTGGAPTGLDCGDETRGPTLGGTLGSGGTGGSREGVTALCGGGGGSGAARGGGAGGGVGAFAGALVLSAPAAIGLEAEVFTAAGPVWPVASTPGS